MWKKHNNSKEKILSSKNQREEKGQTLFTIIKGLDAACALCNNVWKLWQKPAEWYVGPSTWDKKQKERLYDMEGEYEDIERWKEWISCRHKLSKEGL